MEKAILLAIAASLCTATASVCQRLGARSNETTGFDVWLVFRLARRPVWLLDVASMILGFAFQLSALHYGELALVQPNLAGEALALAVVMAGATALSHSCLILGADGDPSCLPTGYQAQGHREQLRKLSLDYQPAAAPQGPAGNRPRNPVTRSPQP